MTTAEYPAAKAIMFASSIKPASPTIASSAPDLAANGKETQPPPLPADINNEKNQTMTRKLRMPSSPPPKTPIALTIPNSAKHTAPTISVRPAATACICCMSPPLVVAPSPQTSESGLLLTTLRAFNSLTRPAAPPSRQPTRNSQGEVDSFESSHIPSRIPPTRVKANSKPTPNQETAD